MRHTIAPVICLAAAVLLAVSAPLQAEVRTTRIVSGLDEPLYVTSDPTDASRLFILEKGGLIKVFDQSTSTLLDTPFLDLSSQVSTDGERGLLGLAFDPDYGTNGQFYVNYTDTSGALQVSQYHTSGNPNVADGTSASSVINIPKTSNVHNGGWIGFDPNSTNPYLYIAVGDDGIGYDTTGADVPTLQTRTTLYGSMLRIDVSGDDDPGSAVQNYAIPSDNPFVGVAGERGEIWSYGLRNPWRASFDRDPTMDSTAIGDLYIGDVGANTREEIDFQAADNGMVGSGGDNYAWPQREGAVANPDAIINTVPSGSELPIYNYPHGDGQFEGSVVTGGYVYRGPDASTEGQYFFADFATGRIYSLDVSGGGATSNSRTDWTDLIAPLTGSIDNVSSFGEDANGNLFMVDFDGEIYRIDPVDEAVTTAAFVDGLYNRMLGRSSDTAGRQNWINEIEMGMMTREDVAAAFWSSAENAGQRVDALYQRFLGRASDPEGRANLIAEIVDNGVTDVDLAVAMLTSLEFHRNHLSDVDFVLTAFNLATGQDITSNDFNLYFAFLQSAGREATARTMLGTGDSIGIFVEGQYNSLLERDSDTGGLTYFVNQILSGMMTADDVASAFGSSQEFVYGVLRDADFGDSMVLSSSLLAEAAQPAAVSSSTAVPEPSAAVLLVCGLAGLAVRRRR
ncbi:MAG: DUF4214 domain-containing protein [Planctomycetales bacterium]|nr:DUF4214 domain-containing protein [Planctomycetales bacterium]